MTYYLDQGTVVATGVVHRDPETRVTNTIKTKKNLILKIWLIEYYIIAYQILLMGIVRY